jgi:hypothetical protein
MVNGPLPGRSRRGGAERLGAKQYQKRARSPHQGDGQRRAFAQILGKFYFLELCENSRRILFNYGQKRRRLANAAFSRAC